MDDGLHPALEAIAELGPLTVLARCTDLGSDVAAEVRVSAGRSGTYLDGSELVADDAVQPVPAIFTSQETWTAKPISFTYFAPAAGRERAVYATLSMVMRARSGAIGDDHCEVRGIGDIKEF